MYQFGFPFLQIADGLEWLSLSSPVGNFVACLLYCLFCLSPVALFFWCRHRYGARREDILLLILSALLFVCIYQLINRYNYTPDLPFFYQMDFLQDSIISSVLYSVILGYLTLLGMRVITRADKGNLLRYAIRFLQIFAAYHIISVCSALFVFIIFEIIPLMSQLPYGFLNFSIPLFSRITMCLPSILMFLMMRKGIALLRAMQTSFYSEKTICLAEDLSKFCVFSAKLEIKMLVLCNILQLIFIRHLSAVNYSVHLPLNLIFLALCTMLLTTFFKDSKKIHDDNEMIV